MALSLLCLLLLCILFLIFIVLNICNFIQRTEQVLIELDISAIEDYILLLYSYNNFCTNNDQELGHLLYIM